MNLGTSQNEIEGVLKMIEEATKKKEEEIKAFAQQLKEENTLSNVWAKAQQEVQENPWGVLTKTAVYSFGAGLFLGSLCNKRTEVQP